jgi:hypothetical protein
MQPSLLQSFAARCAAQSRQFLTETVKLCDGEVNGSFGSPQLIPLMTRHGYKDVTATVFSIERSLLPTAPSARTELTRTQTGTVYLIQAVDTSDPIFFKLVLVSREDGAA